MSFPEGEGPRAQTSPPIDPRYLKAVLPILFFAALGGAIWWIATGLFRLSQQPDSKPSTSAPPSKSEVSVTLGAPLPDRTAEPDKLEGFDAPAAPPPAAPAPVPERVSRRRRASADWKLRGHAYDLTTLLPLADCRISFFDAETNRRLRTQTDAEGSYRLIAPPLSARGYSVIVEREGYSSNYLDPRTPSVARIDAGRRWELAKELAATLTSTPAVVMGDDEKAVVTNFYLAPRR